MSTSSRQIGAALLAGVLFGVGLALSGMTLPAKVIGFLDFLEGAWDPSLALVMVSAIGVHTVAYHLIKGRPSPLIAETWSLPTRRDVWWRWPSRRESRPREAPRSSRLWTAWRTSRRGEIGPGPEQSIARQCRTRGGSNVPGSAM